MNIETFFYNENFYRKLALTIAIIRSTPAYLTPREYTIQLRNILRRNQANEAMQFEQILLEVRSLRRSYSIPISTKPFDLLEYYGNFLQNIFTRSIELNMEIQTIVCETIDRIFYLIKENFNRINEQTYETLFKQLINTIFNYNIIPNIQQHSIEQIQKFLDMIFLSLKQSTSSQMLIEQIGCHPCCFLLVFERILIELFDYFDQSNSNPLYASILIKLLQKLVISHDSTILEQIFNNDSVRQQFHALLYICLSRNTNDISSIIHLWNLYGRIS